MKADLLAQIIVEARCSPSDSEAVMQALGSIPDVSHEALEMMALRALSEPDAFPIDQRLLRGAASCAGASISANALARRADAWRPWRGYAAVHLWAATMDVAKRRPDDGEHELAVAKLTYSP